GEGEAPAEPLENRSNPLRLGRTSHSRKGRVSRFGCGFPRYAITPRKSTRMGEYSGANTRFALMPKSCGSTALYYYPSISCFSCTLFMRPLDVIGNAPTGFSDQSDAIHPAGFPIITISIRCWFAIDIAIRYRSCPAFPIASSDIDSGPEKTTITRCGFPRELYAFRRSARNPIRANLVLLFA
ncbi:MAG: hypothetical protein BECKG1743D_GA0114223_106841, partial [Candidatus Kentron sp. G]